MFDPRLHFILEAMAYFFGFRLYLYLRKKEKRAASESDLVVAVGAVLGAAIGSKWVFWVQEPVYAFQSFQHMMGGKTIVGGFLGGLIGVEIAKKVAGIRRATGDAFVYPITLGMVFGRLGCFFAGLADHTYGVPSRLPWAIDFGDGVPRHPTQLYEIVFVGLLTFLISRMDASRLIAGDRFKLWLSGYLCWRLFIENFKPKPFLYLDLLTGIQLACLAGIIYYLPHLYRIFSRQSLNEELLTLKGTP